MKLWQKDGAAGASALTERFTVGSDREFDLLLAKYDVAGTRAQAQMLHKVGLLSAEDLDAVIDGLAAIAAEIERGEFRIADDVEDVHSQVELMLTERIGDAGKRIHTGRSRNDQVAADIKLYLKDALLQILERMDGLFQLMLELADTHRAKLLPGYTHLQIGMPSSFGLWFSAWAECLTDDAELLAAAFAVVDKNPLGSGAGYGSSFPLDREETTRLLGFGAMQINVVAAQLGRGRAEKTVAMALAQVGSTLSRMCMDICLYMGQNFGFISFPDELTTGSSIMPHKKNPDIFELVRARSNRLQSLPNELALLQANLPSGYHRDMQLTKEILFPGIESMEDCLEILLYALPQIKVRQDILADPKYAYLFSVESVNELVQQGASFRDAYRNVGAAIAQGSYEAPVFDPALHTMSGSMGNLQLDALRQAWKKVKAKFPADKTDA
jgi:argininosuccinate lyase